MRIAYVITTFPSRSETFAAREIALMQSLGHELIILAGTGQGVAVGTGRLPTVLYRPSLISGQAFRGYRHLHRHYLSGLLPLLMLILQLMVSSPVEAACLLRNLHTVAVFSEYLDLYKIEHVHAYFLSWPALIGMALARTTSRTFSSSAHARDVFVEAGALRLKAHHAKFLAVCSKQGMDHLRHRLPARDCAKLRLVYHGVPKTKSPERRPPAGRPESGTYTVAAIGRFVEKKGLEYLLRAFAGTARRRDDVRLIIVGDGPRRNALVALIQDLHLAGRAEIMKWQDAKDIPELLERTDVLVVPSVVGRDGDIDGIPNVILEAFAAGTPVVASNLPGIREAVTHRQTGLLVPPADSQALARAVELLLDDRELVGQLVHQAKIVLHDRFDGHKNVNILSHCFETCRI